MTEHRTIDERISAWLEEEAQGQLPDRVLEAAFDRTRAIRHRPGPSAWRPFTMTRPISALIVVGAAAIVIAIGASMLRPPSQSSVVGGSGSPVASPTLAAPSTAPPSALPSTPSGPPLGLAIVNLDGSIRQDLGLPRDAWTADLTADGSSVIFRTSDKSLGFCGGCTDIHRLAIVRVGARESTYVYPDLPEDDQNRATMISPVWSPDGKRIVYSETGVDGNVDLYVADLATGADTPAGLTSAHARRLTTDPAIDEFPAWTPDGTTIIYDNSGAHPLNDDLFSDTMEIWSVPAAGGKPTRLTNNEFADTQADVSADGTVAFWRNGVIFAMDIDGGHQRRLLGSPPDVFSPRWSPDGRQIALLQYDPSKRASFESSLNLPRDLPLLKVVVKDVATGAVTEVGPRVPSDINGVSWTPDGSALLVNRYDQPS